MLDVSGTMDISWTSTTATGAASCTACHWAAAVVTTPSPSNRHTAAVAAAAAAAAMVAVAACSRHTTAALPSLVLHCAVSEPWPRGTRGGDSCAGVSAVSAHGAVGKPSWACGSPEGFSAVSAVAPAAVTTGSSRPDGNGGGDADSGSLLFSVRRVA